MKIWNVEMGLAVHVEAPNGKYIVIDLGASLGIEPLTHLYGKQVYYMVITHPHKDHFDDIGNIDFAKPVVLSYCKEYSRKELLKDVPEEYIEKFNQYCDFVESYTESITSSEAPCGGTPLGGLKVSVFSTNECDKSNVNNFSYVVVLELNGYKVVVCGDPEVEALQLLMKKSDFCNAVKNSSTLIAPHHGRKSAYLYDFVKLVNPNITIISDTKKKDFSASNEYSLYSHGAYVFNKNKTSNEYRYCLTTRSDGDIYVNFGEGVSYSVEGC